MVAPLRPEPDTGAVVQPETALLWLFLRDFQPLAPPDPLDPLPVHVPARLVEKPRHHPVAVASVRAGQLDDVFGQAFLVRSASRDLALGRAVLPENTAGPALGNTESLPHMIDAPPAARRAQ